MQYHLYTFRIYCSGAELTTHNLKIVALRKKPPKSHFWTFFFLISMNEVIFSKFLELSFAFLFKEFYHKSDFAANLTDQPLSAIPD